MQSKSQNDIQEILNRPQEKLPGEEHPLLEKENDTLSLEELKEKAEVLKSVGNTKYKRGTLFAKHTMGKNDMIDACTKYALALDVVKTIEQNHPQSFADDEGIKTLAISVYLNLAASGLALDSLDSSLNCCNAVLQIDPKHPKALFRRSKVYSTQENYELALKDLDTAIRASPSSKDLRAEYKRVKVLLQKAEEKEAFRRETEEGMRKLELQEMAKLANLTENEKEKEEPKVVLLEESTDTVESEKDAGAVEQESRFELTLESIRKNNLESLIANGAILGAYAWGQSLEYAHILINIPPLAKSSDISLVVKRTQVELKVCCESVLSKQFTFPVTVDETTWEIEPLGCLHIAFFKEHGSREPSPGYEWWPSLFVGDPCVDLADCNVGTDLQNLPETQKREVEKLMWEESRKTPEEKAADEELRKARLTAESEAKQRDENNSKAMKDPKKKALFEMMKDKFPDIPVEFR